MNNFIYILYQYRNYQNRCGERKLIYYKKVTIYETDIILDLHDLLICNRNQNFKQLLPLYITVILF